MGPTPHPPCAGRCVCAVNPEERDASTKLASVLSHATRATAGPAGVAPAIGREAKPGYLVCSRVGTGTMSGPLACRHMHSCHGKPKSLSTCSELDFLTN